jgi:hypothetical protein
VVELDTAGAGVVRIPLKNAGANPLVLRASIETSEAVQAFSSATNQITLAPGGETTIPLSLTVKDRVPGFYHLFVRLETDSGLLRYAWVEARLPGAPKTDSEPLKLDWTKPVSVVYGQDAPPLEVETAIAIAETLESATGRPVEAWQVGDLPKPSLENDNLVFVAAKSIQASSRKPALSMTGTDSEAVERAGMEFILRYWKHAKDSAARRVGLSDKQLPRGVDAVKLP